MAIAAVETHPGPLQSSPPAAWAKIDAYPLDHVRQQLVQKGMDEGVADESVAELRKFFKLIALGYDSLGMASDVVDEAWHTFILFTLDYSRFCDEVFGRFIHHHPFLPGEVGGVREAGDRFREAYGRTFGDPTPTWQQPARCDPDCQGCHSGRDR